MSFPVKFGPSTEKKQHEEFERITEKSSIRSAMPTDDSARYYDHGGLETIEIIRSKLTPEQFIGFLLGNIIKYSCRANFKDAFNSDIRKVGMYAKMLKMVSK